MWSVYRRWETLSVARTGPNLQTSPTQRLLRGVRQSGATRLLNADCLKKPMSGWWVCVSLDFQFTRPSKSRDYSSSRRGTSAMAGEHANDCRLVVHLRVHHVATGTRPTMRVIASLSWNPRRTSAEPHKYTAAAQLEQVVVLPLRLPVAAAPVSIASETPSHLTLLLRV